VLWYRLGHARVRNALARHHTSPVTALFLHRPYLASDTVHYDSTFFIWRMLSYLGDLNATIVIPTNIHGMQYGSIVPGTHHQSKHFLSALKCV
jgi:hypothetical protein